MADLYKVVYVSKRGQNQKVVFVSATSDTNAVAAATTNDADFKQHITAAVLHHSIVVGS